ncbi:M14 family zinc carboxypeptidase [Polaribacter sp. HL-MS24]|uniref:M14 family zinc carboxypeptidase n=1 Tax=Polaribacter sp. HL-MS24 TaxID=3077735 RepID=UPI002934DB73|nr:M14 family zinc carboxypeptidase [Polaribacter sp. HL-MS24]WOC40093.1 M14 family zinc carboxypeptidase [Polaribacter sp. HL-MS24]
MPFLSLSILDELFDKGKETALFGRWIRLKDIAPILLNHQKKIEVQEIGFSEQQRSIYRIKIGTGKKKILIWSQMHGNESTGTKAVFDLLNTLGLNSEPCIEKILTECTLYIIPMLNPDGSEVYTRVNANKVDLNRDAVDRTAVESKLLRSVLDSIQPDFCFNLHDQRTIFGVEGSKHPATISFLAPSEEVSRALTLGRKQTMNVIVAMNKVLQQVIPNAVGRYTDEFYPTATGDTFQKLGYNTILIEAGHFPNDYEREVTRKYNFFALVQGIYHIASNDVFEAYEEYFNIPNNIQNFYDVIHRYPTSQKKDVAFQYEEKIINNQLVFDLQKVADNDLKSYLSHNEIVCDC